MAAKLRELQEKLYVKQNNLASIFEQAKKSDGTYDFTKAEQFANLADGRDAREAQVACLDMIKQLEGEVNDLHDEVVTLQNIAEKEAKLTKQIQDRKKVTEEHLYPTSGGLETKAPQLSLGEMVKRAWPEEGVQGKGNFVREFKHFELKALMSTAAGWAPEATRIPRIAEFAHRPLQVTDLFPVGNTSQYAIPYMEETTSTNPAQETGEGLAAQEAEIAATPRTVIVRKIPVYITVTDEQLADVDIVASLIDARLRFFVQQRLDYQLINGNGVGVNILGLLATGMGAQARGGDPIPDAMYKGATKVRVTGRAVPSAHIVHPDNWTSVRLLRTNDGIYVWGNPSETGPMRMFGIPVVEADMMPLNTSIVGDFTNMAQLWLRQGVEIEAGWINDGFVTGIQAIKATLRAALTVYRPSAFVAITGLNL
jgi:HK97 family phage major capsid protein